jgi:hypothetical protein
MTNRKRKSEPTGSLSQNGQINRLLFKCHQRQPGLGAKIIVAKKEANGLFHIGRNFMLKDEISQEAILTGKCSSINHKHDGFIQAHFIGFQPTR